MDPRYFRKGEPAASPVIRRAERRHRVRKTHGRILLREEHKLICPRASIQHQVTGNVNPAKQGIVQIEATFAPCPPEPSPSPMISSTVVSSSDEVDSSPIGGNPDPPPIPVPGEMQSCPPSSVMTLHFEVREDLDTKDTVPRFSLHDIDAAAPVSTLELRVSDEICKLLNRGHGDAKHRCQSDVSTVHLRVFYEMLESGECLSHAPLVHRSV